MVPPKLIIPSTLLTLLITFTLSLHPLESSCDPFNPIIQPNNLSSPVMATPINKKLRRLPHVFSKVLELPFDSDANVSIEDNPDCLRFVANDDVGGDMETHVVEIHPGVTKVVIRRRDKTRFQPSSIHQLHLNVWRFRLPPMARPEMTRVGYVGGKLVVMVPKLGSVENHSNNQEGIAWNPKFRDNSGRLIVVH